MKKNVLFLLLLVSAFNGFAHVDPRGDIYPIIKIENHKFVLYYFNNVNSRSLETYKFYKTIYAKNGESLSELKKIAPLSDPLGFIFDKYRYIYKLRVGSFRKLENNGSLYLFPSSFLPQTIPFCLRVKKVTKLDDDEVIEKADKLILPPYKQGRIDYIYSTTSSEKNFYITVPESIPKGEKILAQDIDKYPKVFVYTYKLQNSKMDFSRKYRIGNPERKSYNNPTISQLIYYKSKLFVAWVTNVGYPIHPLPFGKNTASLNLTCIDLEKQGAKTFLINENVHPNTFLSMNILDGTIMFAYHQGAVYGKPKSKIVTVFKNIDELLKQKPVRCKGTASSKR